MADGKIGGCSITPAMLQWYMYHLAEALGCSCEELAKLSLYNRGDNNVSE